MDRRDFLKSTGVATTAAALTVAPHASAEAWHTPQPAEHPEIELKGVLEWSPRARRLDDAVDGFVQTIHAASGGRISVTLEHASPSSSTRPVVGDIQFRIPDSRGNDGAFGAILSGLPTAQPVQPSAHLAWLIGGGGMMMVDRLAAAHDRRVFAIGRLAAVTSRVTVAPHTAQSLGVSTTTASGLLADAMSASGDQIDTQPATRLLDVAAEDVGPTAIAGLHPSDLVTSRPDARIVTSDLGVSHPGAVVTAVMSTERWADLSYGQQALLETAATAALARDAAVTEAFLKAMWPSIAKLRVSADPAATDFSRARLRAAAADTIADRARKDREFSMLLNGYLAFCQSGDMMPAV
ncbi:MAG: twin-arginine translocation signal domain-containing protein [Pseudomonadota bacterium]